MRRGNRARPGRLRRRHMTDRAGPCGAARRSARAPPPRSRYWRCSTRPTATRRSALRRSTAAARGSRRPWRAPRRCRLCWRPRPTRQTQGLTGAAPVPAGQGCAEMSSLDLPSSRCQSKTIDAGYRPSPQPSSHSSPTLLVASRVSERSRWPVAAGSAAMPDTQGSEQPPLQAADDDLESLLIGRLGKRGRHAHRRVEGVGTDSSPAAAFSTAMTAAHGARIRPLRAPDRRRPGIRGAAAPGRRR